MKGLFVLLMGLMMGVAAEANSQYTCRETNNGVCAVRTSTGQCTHRWTYDDSDNPMFHCQKFIGVKVSNYNKNNYFCREHRTYVCAASKKTNQCTHSWAFDEYNDPMWECRKFLGIETSSFDKSKFVCKKTPTGACAKSTVTNQCNHQWSNGDGVDAMAACRQWLRK